MIQNLNNPLSLSKPRKLPRIHLAQRLLALTLTMGLLLPVIPAEAGSHKTRYAAGRIIVKQRVTADETQFSDAIVRHGGKRIKRLRANRLHVIDVTSGEEQSTVEAMSIDPNVEYAELDRMVEPEITTANDTYFTYAWHLTKIGNPTALDTAKGNGIVIAILDSGVDPTHPDLAGKLVPGWNLVDNNSNTRDVYGHGTMVAGVVGAQSNNGLGVSSIAWNASIMPVRVALTSGSAYISTIADGIIYAADHGAKIANASFASLTGSPTIQNAANYMRSKGGLVVVAAGNYGTLDSTPNTTAIISVSATNSGDGLTSWSNYGPYVDISAPGEGIWTTTNGGGYASVSGTSFSSPATCGVLALMKSANRALTINQLESILKNSAVDLGTPGYDQYFGNGRINAAAAVAAAVAADSMAPTAKIAAPTGGTVSGTVSARVYASDNVGVTRVKLYAGSTLIGTDSTAPYIFNWNTNNFANAKTTLVAVAFDKAGYKGKSEGVAVTVHNPDTIAPALSILNPTGSSKVNGTVTVNFSASDNVGIATLALYIDGTWRAGNKSTSLSFAWDTGSLSAGTHTLRATATDTTGNKTIRSISVIK